MKIAPVAFNANHNNMSTKGRSTSNQYRYNNYQKLGDNVWARLAYASTVDNKVQNELLKMGLI